jgi:transposase
MKNSSKTKTSAATISKYTIGIDLGDKKHAVCVIDANGKIVAERPIANCRESLQQLSEKYPGAKMVMEVGSHSPWISRFLTELKHEVLVANARKLRAIYNNDRKSDLLDARMLAKIGRLDPSLLHPIEHKSEAAQRDLLQIKLRDNLVRQRVDIISAVRCTLKSLGVRLASPNTNYFAKKARLDLTETAPELLKMIEPSLEIIELMTVKIKELDKRIEELGQTKYPETQRLRQIVGIGPITSLAFVLTIGSPERFASSRDVGAYFGLVPKRDQSGGLDKELRISKAGDAYLRRLLVSGAQYILGPFGPDCDLKRRGQELVDRGGRGAKKKAVVAIARKLVVLMHAMWTKESDYKPLRAEVA